MYIESMNSSVAVNTTASAPTVAPVSTSRPVTQVETDSTVRVETTDGENTQAQESLSQGYKANNRVNANKANDTRTTEEKKAAEHEKIKKAIGKMNAQLPNSEVKFGIHDKTDRVTIKLIDRETKEVIKEFPPEKTLDMIAKCMELAGVLMDEKL